MRLALALLAVLVVAGCRSSSPLYASQALTADTVVDGQADEWPLALRPVPREAGLSIGLRRDADALVVAVIASDERQARRIALGGLRLWIDPLGGQDRVLGVRFPAPEPLGDRVLRAEAAPPRQGRRTGPDALRRRFESSLGTLELTRGPALPQRVPVGSIDGLVTAAAWGDRGLVVEMRVPLAALPGLLPSAASGPVGVGVELADLSVAPPRPAPAERGRGQLPGSPRSEQPRPDAERPPRPVETVTRWLRVR